MFWLLDLDDKVFGLSEWVANPLSLMVRGGLDLPGLANRGSQGRYMPSI